MFDHDRRLFAKEKHPETEDASVEPSAKHRSNRFAKDDVQATHEVDGHAEQHQQAPVVTAEQSTAAGVAAFEQAEKKYAAKDFQGALTGYTKAWEASVIPAEDRGQVAYNIAQCYRMLEDPKRAIVWYQAALASGGVENERAVIEAHLKSMEQYVDANVGANAKFLEGEKLYQAKNYAKAAAAYLAAWEQPGLDADTRGPLALNRAQCLKQLGQYAHAIAWFELALSIGGPMVDGARPEIEAILAGVRAKAGPAAEQQETAATGDTESEAEAEVSARFGEAKALFDQGAWSEAAVAYLDVWETPVVTAENRGAIAYNVAQCYRSDQHYGKAITWYQLALTSGGSEVDRIRPKIQGFLDEAKRKFEAGEAKSSAADNEGKAAVRAKDSDKAREIFEAAENAYTMGDYAVALPLYKEIWELNQGAQGAIAFNIGQCYRKLGQIPQAIAWLDNSLKEGKFDEEASVMVSTLIAELRQQIGATKA